MPFDKPFMLTFALTLIAHNSDLEAHKRLIYESIKKSSLMCGEGRYSLELRSYTDKLDHRDPNDYLEDLILCHINRVSDYIDSQSIQKWVCDNSSLSGGFYELYIKVFKPIVDEMYDHHLKMKECLTKIETYLDG